MTKHFLFLAAALLIGLSSASQPALAAEPEPEPDQDSGSASTAVTPVGLTVMMDLDIEVSDPALESELAQVMSQEFDAQAIEHGLTCVSEGAEMVLHIHVWQPEPTALVIDAELEFEGQTMDSQAGIVCMACSNEDVASKGLSLLAPGVERANAERASATPPAPVVEPEPEPVPSSSPVRRRSVLGPAGYVGIVASGVGLGTTIVGALYLHRGNAVQGDPGAANVTTTDFRPVGVALIGAGLGVMVVGNVLLGVDLGILRDRRDRRGDDRVAVTRVQVWAHDGAGLALHGRF